MKTIHSLSLILLFVQPILVFSKPNIVLLIADDLGYEEMSCQGGDIPTPNIDSIASNGVRFTDGYVTAPYCSASRAGLFSGQYQTRFGYEFNPTGHHNEHPEAGIPMSVRTLPEHLLEAGYVCGLVGKWHLGGHANYHPLRHGFDEFMGFLHEGHYFVPPPYYGATTMMRRKVLPGGGEGRWISDDGRTIYTTHMGGNEPDYDANNPILRNGQPVDEQDHLTDVFSLEAIDFIERNREAPFFLTLAYNAVHSPLQGADRFMSRFEHIEDIHRRIFASMVAHLDESVGMVLRHLRETGLDENTIVIFLSDNGGPTKELTSSNAPLREGKGNVYEGGIRVPFLMQWKGQFPAGVVYEHPISSLDIYATAAAVGGLPGKNLDGVNLVPFLTGANAQPPHETLFWRLGPKTALRHGDWKILRTRPNLPWELYNLDEDISEASNLAESNPERVAELDAIWAELNAEMIEPTWSPRRN